MVTDPNRKLVFDDPQTKALCKRSIALRLYWGLTQVELARRARIPRASIALLETNRARGRSRRLRRALAEAYGVGEETLVAYLSGQLTERDVLRVSSRPPVAPPESLPTGLGAVSEGAVSEGVGPWSRTSGCGAPQVVSPPAATDRSHPGAAEAKPAPAQASRKRGRPPGQLKPGAWRDTGLVQAPERGSVPAVPQRLSYSTAHSDDEWERFPNLAHAVGLVTDHTGAELDAVQQFALALSLATPDHTDRSVLAWAQLLERLVERSRSGSRFNPRSLPNLREAIHQASASAPAELVERAAVEAVKSVGDPRLLESRAWLELIEAHLGGGSGAMALAAGGESAHEGAWKQPAVASAGGGNLLRVSDRKQSDRRRSDRRLAAVSSTGGGSPALKSGRKHPPGSNARASDPSRKSARKPPSGSKVKKSSQ